VKYDEARISKICEALEKGHTRTYAVKLAGIRYGTFRDWEKDKPEFSQRIKKAEESGKQVMHDECLMVVMKAGKRGVWQAAAWVLERLFSEIYKQRTEISEDDRQRIRELFSPVRKTKKAKAKPQPVGVN